MVDTALDRRQVVATLMHNPGALLAIAGLGSPAWDLAASGDRDENFYLWGAMGGAVLMGLGVALAQPERPVLVITGDGEMLMGLGGLATVAVQAPDNLAIVVLDNGHYGETGMQVSHTGLGVDLVGVARHCGFAWSADITDLDGVAALARRVQTRSGCVFARVPVSVVPHERVLPARDGAFLKNRFRRALGLAVS